jgi:ketosteroid isomerase-like protein
MSFERRVMTAVALLAAGMAVSCGGPRPTRVDPAAGRAAIMRADSTFCAETARKGVDGWVSWFAPEGRQFASRGRMPVGPAAIRELMTPAFADTNGSLTWWPQEAVVSDDGTLGYTIGGYEAAQRDSAGVRQVVGTGRYVTIWKKQPDGQWRILVDIGSPDPKPEPAPR